jgi:hypothetical protein
MNETSATNHHQTTLRNVPEINEFFSYMTDKINP